MHRIGVVGFGGMGTRHSNCYQANPEAELAAVVDIRRERRQAAEEKFSIPTYEALEMMLEHEELEVIDVCLPTYLHKDATVTALEAGYHVICEKPMALTVEECRAMVEAGRRSGRFLMVAHVIRFWPEYEVLKGLVESEELGRLCHISCERLASPPLWSWENWMMDPKRSGGGALDLHIHDTDFVLHVLGKPKAVTSLGRCTESGWGHISTLYHYDGATALAEGGWDFEVQGFPFHMAYKAVFERGAVEFNIMTSPTITIFEDGKEPRHPELPPPVVATDDAGINIADLGGYYRETAYFLDCIEAGGKPKRSMPEESMEAVGVCLAEMESAATGNTIEV